MEQDEAKSNIIRNDIILNYYHAEWTYIGVHTTAINEGYIIIAALVSYTFIATKDTNTIDTSNNNT